MLVVFLRDLFDITVCLCCNNRLGSTAVCIACSDPHFHARTRLLHTQDANRDDCPLPPTWGGGGGGVVLCILMCSLVLLRLKAKLA